VLSTHEFIFIQTVNYHIKHFKNQNNTRPNCGKMPHLAKLKNPSKVSNSIVAPMVYLFIVEWTIYRRKVMFYMAFVCLSVPVQAYTVTSSASLRLLQVTADMGVAGVMVNNERCSGAVLLLSFSVFGSSRVPQLNGNFLVQKHIFDNI